MKRSEFWDFVDVRSPDECWVWKGGTRGYGYGYCYPSGEGQVVASRLAFELFYGIDPGALFVLHHCDNPPCCNPFHLFLGTQADNMADMDRKGRRGRVGPKPGDQAGERNNNHKLTTEQAAEIRKLARRGELPQTAIAKQFGVCRSLVSLIKTGKVWGVN